MERAIKKAIEGGWKAEQNAWVTELGGAVNVIHRADILLDTLFWSALGKTEGWSQECGVIEDYGFEEDEMGDEYEWKMRWYSFIKHLADGGNIDDYFTKILKQ